MVKASFIKLFYSKQNFENKTLWSSPHILWMLFSYSFWINRLFLFYSFLSHLFPQQWISPFNHSANGMLAIIDPLVFFLFNCVEISLNSFLPYLGCAIYGLSDPVCSTHLWWCTRPSTRPRCASTHHTHHQTLRHWKMIGDSNLVRI